MLSQFSISRREQGVNERRCDALHSATNASSSASSSTKFDCCLLPACFLVPPLHARAKLPTIPHLLHLLPNAGQ